MRIAVAFVEFPEEVKTFLVETESEEVISHLRGAHYRFTNASDNEHTDFVNEVLIYDPATEEARIKDPGGSAAFELNGHQVCIEDWKTPFGPVDLVVVTGWIM